MKILLVDKHYLAQAKLREFRQMVTVDPNPLFPYANIFEVLVSENYYKVLAT